MTMLGTYEQKQAASAIFLGYWCDTDYNLKHQGWWHFAKEPWYEEKLSWLNKKRGKRRKQRNQEAPKEITELASS